jgi:hypothetical protein
MIHAQSELSFRIRRFAAYFLQAYAFVLIACLAHSTSWSQILFDSALWAGLGTALLIVIAPRAYVLSKGQNAPQS